MDQPEFIQQETKTKVAKRVPKGDRWSPLDNDSLILESLTELLEYVYQKNGYTKFYMDARDGFVHVVTTKEIPKPIEPTKTWSLYGED